MAQQAGTTNLDSLTLDSNLVVGGASTFTGGVFQPGSLYVAAGTVTTKSGYVGFNLAGAGFAVRIPAPVAGAEFRIANVIAPTSGTNTITIPAGGTIQQGTIAGSVLNFTTIGQTAILYGVNTTKYISFQPGTMNPTLS